MTWGWWSTVSAKVRRLKKHFHSRKKPSTSFIKCLVEANEVSIVNNGLAAFFTSVILGGFFTMPNALPKIQHSEAVHSLTSDEAVLHTIQSVSALCAASIMLGFGSIGVLVLWWVMVQWSTKRNGSPKYICLWLKARLV